MPPPDGPATAASGRFEKFKVQGAMTGLPPRRRYRRWIAAGLLASLVIFHRALLQGIYGFLLAAPAQVDQVDALIIGDGEGRFEWAADQIHRGKAETILLLIGEPIRPQRMGIIPMGQEIARAALVRRGVAESQITILPQLCRSDRDVALAIGTWLDSHLHRNVGWICLEIESGFWRDVFDEYLSPSLGDRISLIAMPDLTYDSAAWWRYRSGWRQVVLAYLGRLFGPSDSASEPTVWDPDEYARTLRRRAAA